LTERPGAIATPAGNVMATVPWTAIPQICVEPPEEVVSKSFSVPRPVEASDAVMVWTTCCLPAALDAEATAVVAAADPYLSHPA